MERKNLRRNETIKKTLLLSLLLLAMTIAIPKTQANEIPTFHNGVKIQHEFEGGLIIVNTFYNTDYAEGQWKITDNKNVGIYLFVEKQPEGTTILVEHMHADCLICSNRTEFNGIKQDTMDDKMHTGPQEGFYVSPEYPYSCIFAIEGYTQYLLSIWGFMWGDFGWMSGTEKRLTEDTLKHYGTKGSELMVVFDLLIKHEGEEFYHTVSFMDDFIVYFNGAFQENPGSRAEFEIVTTYPNRQHGWIFWPGLALALVFGVIALAREYNYTKWPFWLICIIGIVILVAGVTCYLLPHQIEVPVVP